MDGGIIIIITIAFINNFAENCFCFVEFVDMRPDTENNVIKLNAATSQR